MKSRTGTLRSDRAHIYSTNACCNTPHIGVHLRKFLTIYANCFCTICLFLFIQFSFYCCELLPLLLLCSWSLSSEKCCWLHNLVRIKSSNHFVVRERWSGHRWQIIHHELTHGEGRERVSKECCIH